MRVLVNALSVSNQSGRHVLMGHLNQLHSWVEGEHDFVVLFNEQNSKMVSMNHDFDWVKCPPSTAHWLGRATWEGRCLNRLISEHSCDFLFTPAGVTVPGIKAPQVVLCQNPWCLVPGLERSMSDKLKAWLQRSAYRRTMRQAELMIFNSRYMQSAYRENAGTTARNELVVYQGISDETWKAASTLRKRSRRKNHVLSVSAMARHKGADTLVKALAIVRENGCPATLTFAGKWPNQSYRDFVTTSVRELGLSDFVSFRDWVPDAELHELYASADVFCLLSRCESFGIPAIEAQSFGTPSLGTTACAIPEVGGAGGLYSKPNDSQAAASNLLRALTDSVVWENLSKHALENARKYQWAECSQPLLNMFDIVASQAQS